VHLVGTGNGLLKEDNWPKVLGAVIAVVEQYKISLWFRYVTCVESGRWLYRRHSLVHPPMQQGVVEQS
jgi:hypothetical protein